MEMWGSRLVFLLLAAAQCAGQHASVSVNASGPLPKDPRPFGKYLTEICTLATEEQKGQEVRTVHCSRVPGPTPPNPVKIGPKTQTIALKLVCDPDAKSPCKLANPKVGGDFFVSAAADSGLPVQQRVLMGSVTPLGGINTVRYHVNEAGTILIRAAMQQTPLYTAATPVDLILQPSAEDSTDSGSCPVLPAAPPGAVSTPLDAPTIVSLLGNPTPFILTAEGPNTIAVYSTRQPITDGSELRILNSFKSAISALASSNAASLGIGPAQGTPFSVVLMIPHASALGDLATRIGGLNFSQFIVQDVGRGYVRITATVQPDCDTWKGFLNQIRAIVWQLVSEPMNTRLFYLSSSDVATAFSGLGSSSGGSSSTTTTAANPSSPSSSSSSPTPSPASSNATISIAQPPGTNIQINSDTTPCVVAGLALGNSSGCGSAPASSASSPSSAIAPAAPATPAVQTPLAMASVAVAAGTGEQNPPDLLVFSDANPGDDAQIQERNRIIAQLDLPRPEMILSAWVTQDSSSSQESIGAFNNTVRGIVDGYDQEFENVVLRSWASVKQQSAEDGFFNEPFRSYIADRFVADTTEDPQPTDTVQNMSQYFLDHSQAKLANPVPPESRTRFGMCETGRYCLGYNDLFSPVKPALTDLLLTIVAAQNPADVADNAILAVEGTSPPIESENGCNATGVLETRKRCQAIWRNLDLDHVSPPPQLPSCTERDFHGILGSFLQTGEPRVHLQCFKEVAKKLRAAAADSGEAPPYWVGLLRAAIADFLYNYKISQQYPHEFSSYELSHSADALNNALSPLIDAFNRDLWSYQLFVRADMQYRVEDLNARTDGRCCVKRLFNLDKPSFFNDGVVTVRTISGQPTTVNTTSQSFLNASTAPELSTLLNALAGVGSSSGGGGSSSSSTGSGATTTTTTTTTTSGGSTSSSSGSGGGGGSSGLFGQYSNLAAVLGSYQTSYAQIGRMLDFTATPRSLAAASSAEITVSLGADESATSPITYTGPGANDPAFNTSRVANHDTTTRVRVDSIKLFEVSSFSAIVERSRSRFPLLPPFVEIPYIGTFAGIPLGPAKEFHTSSAIISAYVVPTAADIAYGLRFAPDLVVDGLNPGSCSLFKGAAGPDVTHSCIFNKMLSLHDAEPNSINQFNKNIVRCFAVNTSPTGCQRVTFDNTLESH